MDWLGWLAWRRVWGTALLRGCRCGGGVEVDGGDGRSFWSGHEGGMERCGLGNSNAVSIIKWIVECQKAKSVSKWTGGVWGCDGRRINTGLLERELFVERRDVNGMTQTHVAREMVAKKGP